MKVGYNEATILAYEEEDSWMIRTIWWGRCELWGIPGLVHKSESNMKHTNKYIHGRIRWDRVKFPLWFRLLTRVPCWWKENWLKRTPIQIQMRFTIAQWEGQRVERAGSLLTFVYCPLDDLFSCWSPLVTCIDFHPEYQRFGVIGKLMLKLGRELEAVNRHHSVFVVWWSR